MVGRTLTGLIFLFLVLVVLPSVTLGESLENTATLDLVGQIGGPIQGVAVQESIAYVTVGPRLMAMEVSDSGSLIGIGGTTALPSFLRDVTVGGAFAYVAAGEAGIYVVDVSTQTNPAVVGSWDSPGFAEAVVVVGTTLYVADGPYGLRTIDVSDPAHPLEIGWAFPLHYAMDVAVSGNVAAIASVTAGLFIADVSNPANPVERGSLMTNGCAFGVDIDGQTAYLADGWGGLATVDISRPWMPEILASFETPGWAMDVAVEDGVAFVGDGFKGLRVVDVSVPSAPEELSTFEFKGHAVDVVVSGGRAFLVDKPAQLRVIDVTDTLNPAQLDEFASAGQVEDVEVLGDLAFLVSGTSGMHVVDVSDASAPKRIGHYDTPGYANNVSIVGDYALITTMHSHERLEILDVSDPTQPTSVSVFPDRHGPYRDLEVSGNMALLPDERGLSVVDISDPADPFQAGWINLGGLYERWATAGVGVQGTLAAVAQAGDGTVFIDVADPANMTVLSRFESAWVTDADLQGNWAYVADVGLLVLDISDPEHPSEAAFVPSSGAEGRGIALKSGTAYMALGNAGILAFDVSTPSDPVVVAGFDSLGFSNKVNIQDELLYVADGEGGLLILEALSLKSGEGFPRRLPKLTKALRESPSQIENESVSRSSGAHLQRLLTIPSRKRPRSLRSPGSRAHPSHTPGESVDETADQKTRAAIAAQRKHASTCQVTSTADSGSGSLRWCLEQAQSGDAIVFDPTVFPPNDPATILLFSTLPPITRGGLTIDASESGVILDGQNLRNHVMWVESDANTIRGLQVYDFDGVGILISGSGNVIGGDRSIGAGPVGQGNVLSENDTGIWIIDGASENVIAGNLVGTDVTGRHVRGNSGHGIHVFGHDNLIGGYEPGERNIVSGNGEAGIALHFDTCVGNRVVGNYAGTDIDGTTALPNAWYGIGAEQGPAGNLIKGNVCSGNEWNGIVVVDHGSSYNSVVGNIVGLDASGTDALGNGNGGIYVGLSSAWFNRVGGVSTEDRNIVSGNPGAGITVAGDEQFVLGNYVGTDVTGGHAIGNNEGVFFGLAEHSFVGGSRGNERNVISGNLGVGVVVRLSYDNVVMGNYIGVDSSGAVPLIDSYSDAVRLDSDSRQTVLQGNVISGNGGAVVIRDGSENNLLRANRVGVAADDSSAVPNDRHGVRIESASNQIGGPYPGDGNIIAHNEWGGVGVWTHPGNSILGNSIYANIGGGIQLEDGGNNSLSAPEITDADANSVQGTTCPGCRVDVFSDEDNQGRVFEGSTVADTAGSFEFSAATGIRGPYVTCTTTDPEGNTSEFSGPAALTFVRRGGRRVSP